MAGQRPTHPEQAPDHQQTLTWSFPATLARYIPLLVAERDLVIEDATIRVEVLDTNTAALTANLAYAASGTALSTNTDITDTIGVGSAATGMGTVVQDFTLAASRTGAPPTYNIVPGETVNSRGTVTKGNTLLLEFSAAPDASMTYVTVTMRVTTKKH